MNALKIYRDAEWALEHNKITLGEFDERIKPLADVEAVVRCKDCDFGKHCQNGKHELSVECHNPEKLVVEVHTPEWFCADGWKEGDGDG